MPKTKINYGEYLKKWNILVVIVHLSSFLALTLISLIRLSEARYITYWFDDFFVGSSSVGQYPIFATLIPFPFITALFHIAAARNYNGYTKEVLKKGTNTLRWIEYSITNGLMTFSLVFIAGNGGNFWIAIVSVLFNFFMQYTGYRHEISRKRNIEWIVLGFVPWIFNWTIVFIYYISRIDTASVSDGVGIIGTFVWSLAFVLPLIYKKISKDPSTIHINYRVELSYILLSLSAKLWLDWSITGGTLTGN